MTREAGLVCTSRQSHEHTETKRYMGDGEWKESERRTYRQTQPHIGALASRTVGRSGAPAAELDEFGSDYFRSLALSGQRGLPVTRLVLQWRGHVRPAQVNAANSVKGPMRQASADYAGALRERGLRETPKNYSSQNEPRPSCAATQARRTWINKTTTPTSPCICTERVEGTQSRRISRRAGRMWAGIWPCLPELRPTRLTRRLVGGTSNMWAGLFFLKEGQSLQA